MQPHREMDKVMLRKNMMNNTNENSMVKQGGLAPDSQGDFYEIRIKGHLDESWSDWLEGLEVKLMEDGEMVLSGRIADQAALMGILTKLYGLNLTLLSVSQKK
jgi:hypothetical protein